MVSSAPIAIPVPPLGMALYHLMAMDRLKLLVFLLMILCSFPRSHATSVAQEYWNSVLPNTPMPKAVRDHLRGTLIPAAEQVAVDAAAGTNPGVLLQSEAEQVTVDASAGTNPGVLLQSEAEQVTVDAAAETNPGVLLQSYASAETEQVIVDAAAGTNPGVAFQSEAEQDTLDAATETNPVVALRSAADQVTVDGEGGTATALIAYHPNKDGQQKSRDAAAAAAAAVDAGTEKKVPAAALRSNGEDVDRIDRPLALSFFLEKDLRRGGKLWFWANRAFSGDYFLLRRGAESIPFSSGRLSQIMESFSVRPDSILARRMRETLRMCEMPVPAVEQKRCATSLESMVDFATFALGTRDIGIASTTAGPGARGQFYTVVSWSAVPIAGETTVACHAVAYPYTVLHCHMTPASRPYRVRLVGANGTAAEAAAMCHADTSAWDPSIKPLVAFNEKPGGAAVCHLLPEGDLLWFPAVSSSQASAGAAAA